MNEDLKNIETCLPEEVASEEIVGTLSDQFENVCDEALQQKTPRSNPYSIVELKSVVILTLRRAFNATLQACKGSTIVKSLKGIDDSYEVVRQKGGVIPVVQSGENLPAAIASIEAGYYNILKQYGALNTGLINAFMDEKVEESKPFGTKKNAPYVVTDTVISFRGCEGYGKMIAIFCVGNGGFADYISFHGCNNLEYIVLGPDATARFNHSFGGYYVFEGCSKLRAILGKPLIIENTIGDMGNCFGGCTSLEEVYIQYNASVSWNISAAPLKYDCLLYLLEHISTVTNSPTLTLGSSNIAKLNATAEGQAAIAAAQAKGWTIS